MENLFTLLVLLGFVLLFGFIVYVAAKSNRTEIEKKSQQAQSLGFSPVEVTDALTRKFSDLYQDKSRSKRHELKNLSIKRLPDADLYLFDLIDASGSEDSYNENQAVAVISPSLHLPHFILYPKVDAEKYGLGGLANKLMTWAVSFSGTQVDFPEYPAFNAKYIVSSLESEFVRPYFDVHLANDLARTSMYSVHAKGDIFTFSEMAVPYETLPQHELGERVNLALDLLRVLQK